MAAKLSAICQITGWSKQRIEKWISDGYFRQIDRETEQPIEDPEPGRARKWSLHDLMRLMCAMRLREMGCETDSLLAIGALHGFKHETAYLVVVPHDRDFVRTEPTVDLGDAHPTWKEFGRRQGTAKRHQAWCVKGGEIARHTHGQGVIGVHVLNLAEIEAEAERLLKRAERLGSR
ncbi:MAG: hypothetical protein O7I42_20800 [Alphaproteobacteria bacterium]|nr:hypothetical protein [Alphaproteobacteria bacterium]